MTRNTSNLGFFISLCLIILCTSIIFAATTGNIDSNAGKDKVALLAIKAGIRHDPLGVLRSWSSNDTLHFCKWQGVACGHRHQRVTALNLKSSKLKECRALQNIRHRNLVKVVTACSGIDYQGNDFKDLVYEYMENGILQDWLHPKPSVDVIGAPRIVNLYQRFNIATDIATALEYLHHQCGTLIVHCDLKPSHVLLGSQMVASVGGFGLAKFLSRSEILVPHRNQSSSIGIRGTVGYAAPEYRMGNEVSTQGDVYSFGILLLELFTGRSSLDDMFKEGLNLRRYVKFALPDHIPDILDHHLYEDMVDPEDNRDMVTHACRSSRETNRRSIMLESLISVLKMAITCSEENPQERMDMCEVASKLSSIKKKLLGTCLQQ